MINTERTTLKMDLLKGLCLGVLLTLLTGLQATPVAALGIGDVMPAVDTAMKNIDKKEVTLAGVQGGKGTLVVFSCRHCPYVRAWEDRMVEIGNAYRKQGVGVIFINANDPKRSKKDNFAEMQTQASEKGYDFPYAVDAGSKVAKAFGAERTPEVYLFDASGKLVYRGAVDDNYKEPGKVKRHHLKEALEAMLAGKPIAEPNTPSYGCSIKWYKEAA